MAYDIQRDLYDILIVRGFVTHEPRGEDSKDKRWVCLTGPNSQLKSNHQSQRVCFFLYGPCMNYEGEKGVVHCRRDFWDDVFKEKEKGHKFHEDAYDLFKCVYHLLEFRGCKSDLFPSANPDLAFFDVKHWAEFSKIVRSFNRL